MVATYRRSTANLLNTPNLLSSPPLHQLHRRRLRARPYDSLTAVMALRLYRALALAALSLSCVTSAYQNYSSIDMMRSQLALMDDRPKDCPPWYDTDAWLFTLSPRC